MDHVHSPFFYCLKSPVLLIDQGVVHSIATRSLCFEKIHLNFFQKASGLQIKFALYCSLSIVFSFTWVLTMGWIFSFFLNNSKLLVGCMKISIYWQRSLNFLSNLHSIVYMASFSMHPRKPVCSFKMVVYTPVEIHSVHSAETCCTLWSLWNETSPMSSV